MVKNICAQVGDLVVEALGDKDWDESCNNCNIECVVCLQTLIVDGDDEGSTKDITERVKMRWAKLGKQGVFDRKLEELFKAHNIVV